MSVEYSADEITARNVANLAYSAQVTRARNTTAQRPLASYNHFLITGQSLSLGAECWPSLTNSPPFAGNVMVGEAVHRGGPAWSGVGGNDFHPLRAQVMDEYVPIDAAAQAALAPGTDLAGETPLEGALTFFRRAWNSQFGAEDDLARKFIGSSVGRGGKTIAELSKGTFEYGRVTACAAAAKATASGLSATYSVPAILFLQGENDYGDGTPKDVYKAAVKQYVADLYADVAVDIAEQENPFAFVTYQTSGRWLGTFDQNLAVSMGQLELALEEPDWYMAGPNYPYTDKDGHFDTNGSRWMGEMLGKVLTKLFVRNEGWQPLHPRKDAGGWRLTKRGREVLIDFHVPEPPLDFDLPYVINTATDFTTKGFAARDGLGDNPIAAVEIVADTMLLLTLSRDTVGDVRVRCGGKDVFNGNACLRDSDQTVSFFNYEYTEGTGQYASANIPALVGQPYPLHNWVVLFDLPVIDDPPGEDPMSSAVAQLAGRVESDYANGGHREVFVPDLKAVATVAVEVASGAESAASAAEQAAGSLAAALEITGGAVAIGGDPLDLPRGTELGSGASSDAMTLMGVLVETHDATFQVLPQDWGKVHRATSGTRTWTLPLAADVPVGWWFVAKNRSGNNLTINRGGSDTIDAAATSLTISDGTSRRIVKASATTWESY